MVMQRHKFFEDATAEAYRVGTPPPDPRVLLAEKDPRPFVEKLNVLLSLMEVIIRSIFIGQPGV